MRKQKGGVILNVGSTAGIRPRPGLTWYNSSKGAVNLLSKSMAVELGARRHPRQRHLPGDGRHRHAASRSWACRTRRRTARSSPATIPLGRLAEPKDIARAAVFLASDDAEFITGVEFPVDGGRTI